VSGLDIDQARRLLMKAWPATLDQLLERSYRPRPVRRMTIPKPNGGKCERAIPTVTDRLIQQALLLMVQPVLDPAFSEHSTGCRSGWRAHDPYLPRSRTCSRLGGSR
jgi:retron-type reverse transcriptase